MIAFQEKNIGSRLEKLQLLRKLATEEEMKKDIDLMIEEEKKRMQKEEK